MSGAAYDEGVGFRASDSYPMLHQLAELAAGASVGFAVHIWADGREDVRVYEWPESVSPDPMSGIGELRLVPGARPGGAAPQPAELGAPEWSPTIDAQAVSALVRERLPDGAGVTEDELVAVEADLGVELPADVRAMYLAAREGDLIVGDENHPFYGFEIVPLDAVGLRDQWLSEQRSAGGSTRLHARQPVSDAVRPIDGSRHWFVVGHDWGGNYYACDLIPAAGGHHGQIVLLDHERPFGAALQATSLTDLLHGRLVSAPNTAPGPVRDGVAYVNDRSGVSIADAHRPDVHTLWLGRLAQPVELAPLAGHAGLRSLLAGHGTIRDVATVASFPNLAYLSLDVMDWKALLDTGRVPPTLLAARVDTSGWVLPFSATPVANTLLRMWNRPEITVHHVVNTDPEPKRRAWFGRRR